MRGRVRELALLFVVFVVVLVVWLCLLVVGDDAGGDETQAKQVKGKSRSGACDGLSHRPPPSDSFPMLLAARTLPESWSQSALLSHVWWAEQLETLLAGR